MASKKLTQLGRKVALPRSPNETTIETFPNRNPDRDYTIRFDCPEFTSLCPITGQPDFGHIVIEYVPDRRCIESKSLKLYLGSFRNEGSFAEALTNRIRDDLSAACKPRRMTVTADFTPRGGIGLRVVATYPN
ncbi:MAG: preQ(1) synthase [Kiritimatiellae bacterium]|nr:preQ(1) synthase [Kiritimatiellia bacterium]